MWKFPSIRNVADLEKIDLNEEEKKWLETFLYRNEVNYTNPRRKGHVYVGKIDDERRYKQRLYLLRYLRDLLDFIKGTGKVDVTESFYQDLKKLSTIWFPEISQGILLQSKYFTRIIFVWNVWKLRLVCKGIEY